MAAIPCVVPVWAAIFCGRIGPALMYIRKPTSARRLAGFVSARLQYMKARLRAFQHMAGW